MSKQPLFQVEPPVTDPARFHRFTPLRYEGADDAPVYLLKVATATSRIEFRRAQTQMGLENPSEPEMFDCIRAFVKREIVEDSIDLALDIVDQYEAALTAIQERSNEHTLRLLRAASTEESIEILKEIGAAADELAVEPSILHDFKLLETQCRRGDALYRSMKADREYWIGMAPRLAAAHFLAGAEKSKVKIAEVNGVIPESVLEKLPPDDVPAIGWEALQRLTPTLAEIKNSASPSESASDQESSTQDEPPRTAVGGTSTTSDSTSTPSSKSEPSGSN